jgi:hypothetical protein
MKYEYKVIGFVAEIKQSDIGNGAKEKVAGQLEALFEDYAIEGWELQGQYTFNVQVAAGCLASLQGGGNVTVPIDQLVFRKQV